MGESQGPRLLQPKWISALSKDNKGRLTTTPMVTVSLGLSDMPLKFLKLLIIISSCHECRL